MHVIVIGAGEVGSSIAASLAEDHDVVVIDTDPARVEKLTYSYDVLAIHGDGTELSILEEAGIAASDMVIASTDDDEINLVACSTAKVLTDAFTIARVRNTSFLRTWRRANGAFGADFMVCTNLLAAQTIVRLAGLPAAIDVDTFADGRIQMAEFSVTETSPIANQTVSAADRFENLTFAAVIHEDTITIPSGHTMIEPGDEIVVIGPPDSVRAFSESIAPDEARTRNVIVIGGGSIAEETARQFADRGLEPRLVDHDETRARRLAEDLPDVLVMAHDPTDVEFLHQEQVDKAELVVASLDTDERTLLVSLLAKQAGARRTVAVVQTGEYVDLFEAVGVDVAINPREVVAEEITRFTRERRTENIAVIESDRAEVIEVEVDAASVLAGRPIHESAADLPDEMVIGALTRGDTLITPRGGTVIEPGDHVVILVDVTVRDAVLEAI